VGGGGTGSIWGKGQLAACLAVAGFAQGQEQQPETLDLRALVEKQQKQLEQQQRQIQELTERINAATADANSLPKPRPVQEGQQPKDTPPRSEPSPKKSPRERPGPSVTDVTPKPSAPKKQTEKTEQTEQPAAPAPQNVEQYLQDNPGAGMPPGVQTGFEAGRGFFIRSPPNPPYIKWQDEAARIPFELRIRGRVQTDYYFYKVTEDFNH
jgi:outer membrane biosynthesis protein TonB